VLSSKVPMNESASVPAATQIHAIGIYHHGDYSTNQK